MLRYILFTLITASLGWVCYDLGQRGAQSYERMQVQRVTNGLEALGIDWARIEADGLHLELHGHAPDSFARELALESAQATAAMARIESYATATLAPPEHRDPIRVELHRDTRGITMTGQTASRVMRDKLNAALARLNPDLAVQDLTGIQAAQPSAGLGPEMNIATLAATSLSNAYVVMEPRRVSVEGEVADEPTRDALTEALLAHANSQIAIALRLNIPPEVIVPFAFSAYKDPGGGIRLERCAARNSEEQAVLHAMLSRTRAEMPSQSCPIGLGGPSGAWVDAIGAALAALDRLPAGRIDVEYRSVRVIANPPTSPHLFEEIEADLVAAMPEGFTALGEVRDDDIATLTSIGREQFWMRLARQDDGIALMGQVPGNTAHLAIRTYASALFGSGRVYDGLVETDAVPPSGWQTSAIKILDTLALAQDGEAEMAGRKVRVAARVIDPQIAYQVHKSLYEELPDYDVTTTIRVDLPQAYDTIALPGPPCAGALSDALRKATLDFDTGSAVLAKASAPVLDTLSKTFRRCRGDRIEVGGHTDAKGSEELNQRLSQARAQAVVDALVRRGIPLDWMVARGYGEAVPIADNKTEAGRARNRRIEFKAADALPEPEDE